MSVLQDLEPKKVFHYFEEICNIPHPSYKEEKISNYLVAFAKAHNLEYVQDELFNVVMIAPATSGYENEEPIIIQGHMDMVCEKEADCDIDFDTEGLRLRIDGDYVTAQGTTLGGDDGIAVAYALAILDSPEVEHPRLEVVITVSEEVGMEGAAGVDLSMLQGHKLLNIDSEQEGIMTVSCAGGNRTFAVLPIVREWKQGKVLEVSVTGLCGGHSGVEIDKGRANANLIAGRLLRAIEQAGIDYQLVSLSGGSKQNAIPREARMQILLSETDATAASVAVAKETKAVKSEYASADPEISVDSKLLENKDVVWAITAEATKTSVMLLNQLPRGIQSMSMDIPGLVETSLNLGVLNLEDGQLTFEYCIRSSIVSARDEVTARIKNLVEYVGGSVEVTGEYPAWEYRRDSELREDMMCIYEQMYGKKPVIEAIHAGLECGILAGKIQNLDGVSIGPDMIGIHTAEEKLSISSTKRVYEYVLEVLKCKHKN